jgi:hypothetical protein
MVALVLCGNAFAKMAQRASADMAMASLAPPPVTYQIPVGEVKNYYEGLKKTRTLSDQETMIHNLTMVAATLKAQAITCLSKGAAAVQVAQVNQTIVKKIKEHPTWDDALGATEVKAITPHLEIIKNTMGEKSYGWAWFLKQTGKTAEAKQLLTALFNERSAAVLKLEGTYNHESPLLPVLEVEQALIPLSNDAEKAGIQKKMQELKVHVSNLQDYMIQT